MNQTTASYAIIPAAGHSRRMGSANKLLLPWNGRPLIEHVVQAWTDSGVDRVLITIRKDDLDLQRLLSQRPRLEMVVPDADPVDMKESIQQALRFIGDCYQPAPDDRWMVAPADLPTLDSALIDALIERGRDSPSIVAPRFGDRPGHPVSFPWSLCGEVFGLASDKGINHLVAEHGAKWVEFPPHQRPVDVDTPDDYRRLRGQRPAE